MKNKCVDFSGKIKARLSLDTSEISAEIRLLKALAFLSKKHNLKTDTLLQVYKRGYLSDRLNDSEGSRAQKALARVLLFVRMEDGKTVPYTYKKLDQDISDKCFKVFDDKERPPLVFNKMQIIEATLLGRKFGIEHDEEEIKNFLDKFPKN